MIPKPIQKFDPSSMSEHTLDKVIKSPGPSNDMYENSKVGKVKKILIIEDQPDIRKLVKMTLDFNNYEIYEASEADSGFGLIKGIEPDIILLDIMMPGEIDGINLCVMLKSLNKFKHIPVVLLTARGQLCDKQAGIEAGADEYIVKPFSPIKLIEIVESLIKKSKES